MKVRFRALVIAMVILVVIDLALRIPGLVLPIPEVYRLPSRTVLGYSQLVKSMTEQTDRVAVVGDSIVWGSPLMPGETLATYLTTALRKQGVRGARAYNLGFVGAHSNDLMPLIAELSQKHAADAILLNLDYRFYNSSSPVQSRYPEIYDRVAWAEDVGPGQPHDSTRSEAQARRAGHRRPVVERWWKLYSIRDYLMVSLFKDTPSGAVTREAELARIRADGRPVWIKRRAAGLPLDEIRKQLALGTLTEDSVYVRYLGAALDTARAEGVPVVCWRVPSIRRCSPNTRSGTAPTTSATSRSCAATSRSAARPSSTTPTHSRRTRSSTPTIRWPSATSVSPR